MPNPFAQETGGRPRRGAPSPTPRQPGARRLRQRCNELERQLAETRQELAQAEPLARLGRQVAEVTHAIRGPLGGLEGFAAALAGDLDGADPRHRLAQRMRTSARTLRERVDNVLAIGRPRPLRLRPASLCQLLEDGLALVQAERRSRGWEPLEVRREYATPLPTIAADPERLSQALLNLLLNASQVTGERGELSLALRREAQGPRPLVLVIADRGPGIPPHLRPRVFEPFFTTRSGGSGLGLAAARRIVENHGGRLELESSPDEGTAARITLPCPTGSSSASGGDDDWIALPEGPGRDGAGAHA